MANTLPCNPLHPGRDRPKPHHVLNHDIGIALDVIPKYHLDNSIFVDLNVEVSSLGLNLGTKAAPAYAISTRNVHTTMILREGETAVLGGLISENEQKSLNGLPGIDPNGIFRAPVPNTTTAIPRSGRS